MCKVKSNEIFKCLDMDSGPGRIYTVGSVTYDFCQLNMSPEKKTVSWFDSVSCVSIE